MSAPRSKLRSRSCPVSPHSLSSSSARIAATAASTVLVEGVDVLEMFEQYYERSEQLALNMERLRWLPRRRGMMQ